jgi:hypothetical protein
VPGGLRCALPGEMCARGCKEPGLGAPFNVDALHFCFTRIPSAALRIASRARKCERLKEAQASLPVCIVQPA